MKYFKKDRTIYDIKEIHFGYETSYKVKNLTTGTETVEKSISDYVKCETAKDRMIIEVADLEDKISKLYAFLDTEKFNSLPDKHKVLLDKQHAAMKYYRDILNRRLELMQE